MGVLTPPNLILLDNARTLKIQLYPEDNRGERIIDLVNKKSDTLGAVNHLCYSIRCMDARDKTRFFNNLDNGAYNTLAEAQQDADKLREQRKIKNKDLVVKRIFEMPRGSFQKILPYIVISYCFC